MKSAASSSWRRRRILVCTPFGPRLDARHGGKATAQLLLRLAERNDVALLALVTPGEEGVDPRIAQRCAYVEEIPRPSPRLARRISWGLWLLRGVPPWAADCRSATYRRRLNELIERWHPEIVEIHFQAMASYVTAPVARNVATILVDYDPPSAWAKEMLASTVGPRRAVRRLEVAAWRRNERRTRRLFDAIVVFADRDVHEIERDAQAAAIVRIPLAVEVPPDALDPAGADPPNVVFVGGFAHPPNVDAALWLAQELFPRIRADVPNARLELVGHQPGDTIRALESDCVFVRASVPDVTPYLDHAAVVVAPIRLGGSMRMKVLEALAHGKALVATPRAAEGVEAVPGEHFLLASDDDEVVSAVTALLLDRTRRMELAASARSWAEEHLGWENGVSSFEQLYGRLARDGAATS